MTRRDRCRQVSPEHLRACGVSEQTIKELEQTRLFTEEHPQICESSTEAIKTVMKIPDEETKGKVISHIESRLEKGQDPITGKFSKKTGVTAKQVKQVIAKIAPTPTPTPTPATVATIAHVPEEKVIPTASVVTEIPINRVEPPKLIIHPLPLPASHIPTRDIEITPTSGQWRSIHNAIMRGDIKPDSKANKDVWEVGCSRAWEKACEVI